MPAVDPKLWGEASPLLDEVLSLPLAERAAWLQALGAQRPKLAGVLGRLLEEHRILEAERFLEHSPVLPSGEPCQAGEVIGAYRLVAHLDEGGMGTVWLARRADGRFDRQVAIKFLNFPVLSPAAAESFRREGKILGRLRHPQIAGLMDAGTTSGGCHYLVLEYVQGQPIDEFCQARGLAIPARIQLFLGVVAAVEHAHAHLVIHRDLKPSNVLVGPQGEVKLLDFGIAKLLDDAADGSLPARLAQAAPGPMTPMFAAPEQLAGGPITTATDVYALGGLLFLLLTGAPAAARGPALGNPPLPSLTVTGRKQRRMLHGDLDAILATALNQQPTGRYASAAALGADLRRFLEHQPITARPAAHLYRLRKYVRRHRAATVLAAAVVLLLAGSAVLQTLALRRVTRERDRANRVANFMTGIFRLSDPQFHTGQPPTARAVLDHAAAGIRANLRGDPVLRAELLHTMARAYLNLGLFSQAEALYREAIQASQTAGAPHSPEALRMTHDLAWAVQQQGRSPEAEAIERKLLASQRRWLGLQNLDTLATTEELAFTVCTESRARCVEGIQLTRNVLRARERVSGPDAGATLATMDNLAVMLASDGRLADAVALEQQSLQRHLRKSGPNDLGTVNAMLNLGEFQRDAGQLNVARGTLENLLKIENQAFSPDQVETAQTRYDLASILLRQRQPAQALALLRQALDHGLAPRTAQGLATDPLFASLRQDPRFRTIVVQAGKRFPRVAKK